MGDPLQRLVMKSFRVLDSHRAVSKSMFLLPRSLLHMVF